MPFRTLADWLAFQEQLHPNVIDLGLERLTRVLARLHWVRPHCPVITVGGTNGKGSCVALLAAIGAAAGYRVGTFTSPHLIRYNERIKIDGSEISDASLLAAFERIEAARGDISLTFFEFNTLAALLVFDTAGLDLMVLEVGLGGRLDAVNVVDADVALVSSIALDHCDWLGPDVESIGREKAGIFRRERPAIFGSRARPQSIVSEAQRIGAPLFSLGEQFNYELAGEINGMKWNWHGPYSNLAGLPLPNLFGMAQFDNASAVLTALDCLRERLPISRAAIEQGLRDVALDGRFQVIAASFGEWLLDVAHNPAAAGRLAANLTARSIKGRTLAVCGMFADKDVGGVISALHEQIDLWIAAPLSGSRALPASQLAAHVTSAGGKIAGIADSVAAACELARELAHSGDRIVVFGSFHAVGPALAWLQAQQMG